MSSYQSNRVEGITYFFTVRLEALEGEFLVDNLKLFQMALRSVMQERPFHIDAMVLLPDHIHCMWTLPILRSDFLLRWHSIEKRFTELLYLSKKPSSASVKSPNQIIWQQTIDRSEIIDELDYKTHMDYIHFNPVKHGLVDLVVHWPYSTFHRLSDGGLYPIEWGEDVSLGIEEVV
jgi:putative transposase